MFDIYVMTAKISLGLKRPIAFNQDKTNITTKFVIKFGLQNFSRLDPLDPKIYSTNLREIMCTRLGNFLHPPNNLIGVWGPKSRTLH